MPPQGQQFKNRELQDWVIDVEDAIPNRTCIARQSEPPTNSHYRAKLSSLILPKAVATRSNHLSSYKAACFECRTATKKGPFHYPTSLGQIRAVVVNLKVLAVISFLLNIVLLWPTFISTQDGHQSLKYSEWQSVKDYRDYCKNEPNDKSAECQQARTMTLPPPPAYSQSSSIMLTARLAAASPLEMPANSVASLSHRSATPSFHIESVRPKSNTTRPALWRPPESKLQLTTTTIPPTSAAAYPGHGATMHQPQATGMPSVKTAN
ncbi:hypothetical protein AOQ84DRAFT_414473 [Glonium stellatum]|uniref:Uncharacterized protein n=1 Tax=Glonium stellatum TaxID=574774 RepID=A0A8E2JQ81_9PEZI|nr:hypothetical protein AOQ84DRAFT_414473 [Glonium stellatum]